MRHADYNNPKLVVARTCSECTAVNTSNNMILGKKKCSICQHTAHIQRVANVRLFACNDLSNQKICLSIVLTQNDFIVLEVTSDMIMFI